MTAASVDGTSVTGSIDTGAGVVGVQLNSDEPVAFNNINNTGINYWTGSGYTYNGDFNQPQTSDIVALSRASTETITSADRSPTSIWRSTAGPAPTSRSIIPSPSPARAAAMGVWILCAQRRRHGLLWRRRRRRHPRDPGQDLQPDHRRYATSTGMVLRSGSEASPSAPRPSPPPGRS